ncbi:hypothetical protein HAX54_042393 [Datura stramonium]|uniref:Uncharacterized protein n=1 Tax=Datura stramonium TaxID=4076 RepID=A0ABS8SLY1_DATST|nr:hypothetical protein [Datura stramonium]
MRQRNWRRLGMPERFRRFAKYIAVICLKRGRHSRVVVGQVPQVPGLRQLGGDDLLEHFGARPMKGKLMLDMMRINNLMEGQVTGGAHVDNQQQKISFGHKHVFACYPLECYRCGGGGGRNLVVQNFVVLKLGNDSWI